MGLLCDCQNNKQAYPSALTAWFLCLRRIVCYEVGNVPVRKFSRHCSWWSHIGKRKLFLPTTWRRVWRVHVWPDLFSVRFKILDSGTRWSRCPTRVSLLTWRTTTFPDGRRLDSVLGYSYNYSFLTSFIYQGGQRLGFVLGYLCN